MSKHTLSLEVLETMNEGVLRVTDLSVYSEDLPVECPLLEITLPGFAKAVEIGEDTISTNFALNLTACDLGVQTTGCGTTYSRLPDGIYVLKYSVSPNDAVYVEYNHLRVAKLLTNYQKVLCDIDVQPAEPLPDIAAKLEQLNKIKMYIEAAKAKVEVCHDPVKGSQLYTYAKDLLAKFDCTNC